MAGWRGAARALVRARFSLGGPPAAAWAACYAPPIVRLAVGRAAGGPASARAQAAAAAAGSLPPTASPPAPHPCLLLASLQVAQRGRRAGAVLQGHSGRARPRQVVLPGGTQPPAPGLASGGGQVRARTPLLCFAWLLVLQAILETLGGIAELYMCMCCSQACCSVGWWHALQAGLAGVGATAEQGRSHCSQATIPRLLNLCAPACWWVQARGPLASGVCGAQHHVPLVHQGWVLDRGAAVCGMQRA